MQAQVAPLVDFYQRSDSLPAGGGVRAFYWPSQLLEAFSLQMASHGFSVSASMMMGDSRYAVEQLALAHTLADDRLRHMALSLFEHFERQQSGIVRTH